MDICKFISVTFNIRESLGLPPFKHGLDKALSFCKKSIYLLLIVLSSHLNLALMGNIKCPNSRFPQKKEEWTGCQIIKITLWRNSFYRRLLWRPTAPHFSKFSPGSGWTERALHHPIRDRRRTGLIALQPLPSALTEACCKEAIQMLSFLSVVGALLTLRQAAKCSYTLSEKLCFSWTHGLFSSCGHHQALSNVSFSAFVLKQLRGESAACPSSWTRG